MEDEGTLLDKVGGLMNVCGLDMWKNLSCILAWWGSLLLRPCVKSHTA